jgi:hypothetical protein
LWNCAALLCAVAPHVLGRSRSHARARPRARVMQRHTRTHTHTHTRTHARDNTRTQARRKSARKIDTHEVPPTHCTKKVLRVPPTLFPHTNNMSHDDTREVLHTLTRAHSTKHHCTHTHTTTAPPARAVRGGARRRPGALSRLPQAVRLAPVRGGGAAGRGGRAQGRHRRQDGGRQRARKGDYAVIQTLA